MPQVQIEGLDHVGLSVLDPRAAQRFFSVTLGLERDDRGFFRIGRTALELIDLAGSARTDGSARAGIDHLALRVPDLERALAEAAAAGLRTAPDAAAQTSSRGVWLEPEGTVGVRLHLVERSNLDDRSYAGADGLIERLDHIGIASVDNARARRVFADQLGLAIESTQTDTEVRVPTEFFVSDKYGVVFKTRPAELVGGLKTSFFTLGDCELEVLQDYDPSTAAERTAAESGTRRDQSAISRFIQSRGQGPHHLALKVRDIEAMLRRLETAGLTLLDSQGRPGGRRAQIAFLHPRSTFGTLFHLVQRDELPG